MPALYSTPLPAAGSAAPDLVPLRLAARDRAGELNAQKREGPGDDRASAGGQAKKDKVDSAADLPMLKARAAQRGITVVEATDGLLIARWGRTLHAPSLDRLRAALARMGVKA